MSGVCDGFVLPIVIFAWCIQHILKGVFAVLLPLRLLPGLLTPTASCSPWSLCVLHCSDLPIAILSIRLFILPLVVVILVVFVVVVPIVLTATEPRAPCFGRLLPRQLFLD